MVYFDMRCVCSLNIQPLDARNIANGNLISFYFTTSWGINVTENNILTVESVDGRPSKIIYETLSGVIFHITPLSLPTLRAIQLKAADIHPYPDKAPYQVPDPVEVAFTEGQKSRAEDNPDYIEACKKVDTERAKWVDKTVFTYAAKMPKYPTKEAVLTAYEGQLKALKEIAVFDKDDDDYDVILLNFILTGNADYATIIRLAVQAVALTPEEVSAGIRFFRPRVPK